MRRRSTGSAGVQDTALSSIRTGFNPEPPQKQPYKEAVTTRGQRGRVVEEQGDTLLIELYATGDRERLRRQDVTVRERWP